MKTAKKIKKLKKRMFNPKFDMKKNHVVIEHDPGDGEIGVFEAAVTKDEINNQRISMWYSQMDGKWTKQFVGTECIKVHDDGNGVWLNFPHNGTGIFYDYSQIEYVMLALEYYDKYSGLDQWKPRTRVWSKKKYKKWKKKSLKYG